MLKVLYKSFRYFWVGSIITFFISIVGLSQFKDQTLQYQTWGKILGISVGVGILFYLLYLIFRVINAKNKEKAFSRAVIHGFIGSTLCVSGAIGIAFLMNGAASSKTQGVESTTARSVPSSPQPSPKVQGVETTKTKPVVNSDPVITCNISAECGGGSRQMKKSECNQTTCCQIGNNWYFYLSKDKCIQDQKNNQPQQVVVPQTGSTTNKVPVFLTYGKYTIYCPPQNVDAVKSIDATMTSKGSEWAKNYNTCADNYYKTNSCYVACHDTETSQLNSCYAQYGYSGSGYTTCTNSAFDGYGTCIKSCTPPTQTCDYVYWEQKSLSSQISNLCK